MDWLTGMNDAVGYKDVFAYFRRAVVGVYQAQALTLQNGTKVINVALKYGGVMVGHRAFY